MAPEDRIAVTLRELAELIGIPERTLRWQVEQGLFPVPSRQVGRRRLYSVKAVEEWLSTGAQKEAS